jgi:hypothetical protein
MGVTSTSQREPEVWRGGAALAGLDRFRREVGCPSVVLAVDAAVAANGYRARVGVFEPVAAALGVAAGKVPDRYRQLWAG